MCLGKVWGVKQLCLSVFHIADSIGSGRGRHGPNSLEREILSYVFAANGLEGEKEGEILAWEKKRATETNRSILAQKPCSPTEFNWNWSRIKSMAVCWVKTNFDMQATGFFMGRIEYVDNLFDTKAYWVGFQEHLLEVEDNPDENLRGKWRKAEINFSWGMANPYEVFNFILSLWIIL